MLANEPAVALRPVEQREEDVRPGRSWPRRLPFGAASALALALATLAAIAFTAWLFGGFGGDKVTTAVDDWGEALFALLGAAACGWRAWRLRGSARLAWALIGGSALAWSVGETLWSVYETLLGISNPFPSPADAGFLLALPLAVAGLFMLPDTPFRTAWRPRTLLDGLVVASALLAISWTTTLGATYRTSSGSDLAKAISLAYPVGDVVLLTIVVLILSRARGDSRLALLLLAAGIGANALADSSFAYLTTASQYSHVNLLDAGWVYGYLLIGAAALSRPAAGVAPAVVGWSVVRAALPYLAALVAIGAVAVYWLQHGSLDSFLFWDGVALAALIVFRQLSAQLENRTLLLQREAARRDLEASEERLSNLIDLAPVLLLSIGADQKVDRCEGSALDNLPHSADSLVGQSIGQALGVQPELDAAAQRALAGERAMAAVEVDGRMLETQWVPIRARDDRVDGALAIGTDVTERRKAEAELAATARELARSNAELEQFAYVASHDLQEPLRMVRSYVELLQRRYGEKLDSDADEFIGFAVDGARRMQVLISDLLIYARVNSKGKPLVPTDTDRALELALENLQMKIRESKARVSRQPLPRVIGDESQLVQLFQNLVSNGVKFRRGAPRVAISAATEGDLVHFSVSDNGIGIEPQYSERIFVLFQRLHTRTEYPGTGIGLALCKKIVERHGGRIWFDSRPGRGSTFQFTLPVAR
ncbi:MAG TPA: ATP-binding protein [Candidatus Acidoferrales bacterium]|nr:ATP-binding protein [Candidatus Acidoferrales bacterium]